MRPNQIKINLEGITLEPKARLLAISKSFAYENGKKTDQQIGWALDCIAETNAYEKFRVKVTDPIPVITADELSASSEPVYVTFSPDFVGKFYENTRTGTWEISCKATKAQLVKTSTKNSVLPSSNG